MCYELKSGYIGTLSLQDIFQSLKLLFSPPFVGFLHNADGNLVSMGLLGSFSDRQPPFRITPDFPSEYNLYGQIR